MLLFMTKRMLSAGVLALLLLLGSAATAQGLINKLEYFFDTDPGFGSGTAVTVSPAVADAASIQFTPSLSALSNGPHRLFVRTQDDNGRWSATAAQMVYKEAVVLNALPIIQKLEWFIDTDPGFGNGNAVGLGSAEGSPSFAAPISSLSNGLHYLYVRALDAEGRWSLVTTRLFYKEAVVASPLTNLTEAEYFFDTDPGRGNATPVSFTAGQDVVINFTAAISSLSSGMHRLFVRTRDASGNWSLPAQQVFYKEAVVNSPLVNLTAGEYFFDTDPGIGSATAISFTPGQDLVIPVSASIASLSNGLHRFFVRTRDASGNWSITAQQLFFKEALVNPPLVNLTAAEYFFDTDPGFGNGSPITFTAGQDVSMVFTPSITALSNGLHRLFVRTQDATGRWSLTSQQLLYKEAVVPNGLVNITAAEYYFDTDPGFGSGTPISVTAGQDIVINFGAPLNALSTGLHRLFVRTRDASGRWSMTAQHLLYREAAVPPTATDLVTLEYFWNTDPGFGNATRVTVPANSGEVTGFTFPVAVTGALSNGKHNLFVRVLDATDWSLTTVRVVDFTGIILPVTLLQFTAMAVDEKVRLQWVTTNEVNNHHFVIERSSDGIRFSPIGRDEARGNGGGQTTYTNWDNQPLSGMNYYRLKQVDIDGRFTYSPVIAIRFDRQAHLVQVFPNPATVAFTLRSGKRFRQVTLTDMNGKRVQQWTPTPDNTYRLQPHAKGAYLLVLTAEDGTSITRPLLLGGQ
jgi:hypothetical protein